MSLKATIAELILNATAAGRAMLTAADAAAQKVLLSIGNVDNTSDANKPVSTAQAAAIASKIGGSTGATANRVLTANGTGGSTAQACPVGIDGSGNVTGVAALTATGVVKWMTNGGITNIDGTSYNVLLGSGSAAFRVSSAGLWVFNAGGSGVILGDNYDCFLKRSGTGTARLSTDGGTTRAALEVGAITASALMCAGTYTVSTLPSASANAYKFATVSDSSVTAFGSTVAGSGSSKVMVFSNGSNWTVCAA